MLRVEKSKSKRARCKICRELIEDSYRVYCRHDVGFYYHIRCLKEFADNL